MFEWLQAFSSVAKRHKSHESSSRISIKRDLWIDHTRYPLITVSPKGFVASLPNGEECVLVPGQRARVRIDVDDIFGRLSFAATVTVLADRDGRLMCSWYMPDTQQTNALARYAANLARVNRSRSRSR